MADQGGDVGNDVYGHYSQIGNTMSASNRLVQARGDGRKIQRRN